VDLKDRKFDVVESMKTLRRLRNRVVAPDDRRGESESECEAGRSAVEHGLPF
jgi:hypothetical protein